MEELERSGPSENGRGDDGTLDDEIPPTPWYARTSAIVGTGVLAVASVAFAVGAWWWAKQPTNAERAAVTACTAVEDARMFELDGILAAGRREAGGRESFNSAFSSECPDVAIPALMIEDFPNQVDLKLDNCTRRDGADGTVTNNNLVRVTIFVEVDYLTSDGTLIDVGRDSVTLNPGQTGRWDAYGPRAPADRCQSRVDQVSMAS